jgi:copper chaperone CopZ
MRTIELFVSGMRCRRCVREVTAGLRDVPGVDTVAANASTSMVRLVGSMSLDEVLSAFDGTSYTPRLVNDQGYEL